MIGEMNRRIELWRKVYPLPVEKKKAQSKLGRKLRTRVCHE